MGTGPYKIVEFKPGDVALYELNSQCHVPNRPFFDTVELKGGGDATSAARAVIQTGELDFAWNMLVEKDVLDRIERHGTRGSFHIYPGAGLEHIQLNRTDPWTEVDGERSSLKVPHPFLTDLLVRRAYNVAVDRRAIVEHLYGSTGQVTSNVLNSPLPFQSPNTRWEFNLEKAAQWLNQAGWQRGSDGSRIKDGRRMKILYQTAVNPVRQKTQVIVKKSLEQIGVEVEVKAVNAGAYFSSDPGNPDTIAHFYADVQMYNMDTGIDPQGFMQRFVSWEIAKARITGRDETWCAGPTPSTIACGKKPRLNWIRSGARAVHPHERPPRRGCGGHPSSLAQQGSRGPSIKGDGAEHVGLQSLGSGVLVSAGLGSLSQDGA